MVLHKAKKYIMDNLYTANRATMSQVNKCRKIKAIEGIAMMTYS